MYWFIFSVEPPQILPIDIPTPPPDITVVSTGQPSVTSIVTGSNVNIYCPSSGVDRPVIVWFKDGTTITSGGRISITTTTLPDTAITGVLSINDFQPGDIGTYSCRSNNIAGVAVGETTLGER